MNEQPKWQSDPPVADGWYVVQARDGQTSLAEAWTEETGLRVVCRLGSSARRVGRHHLGFQGWYWWPVPVDLPPLPDEADHV